VPVMLGDPQKWKEASDLLLAKPRHLCPADPTVPRGTERLRITPTPFHDDALIDALAEALVKCGVFLVAAARPCARGEVTCRRRRVGEFAAFHRGGSDSGKVPLRKPAGLG